MWSSVVSRAACSGFVDRRISVSHNPPCTAGQPAAQRALSVGGGRAAV
jgi:hypothetical protein